MSIKRNASFMALPFILAACGGEEQGKAPESTPEPGVTLSLKDASLAYSPSVERHEVNLSHYVTTSDNSPFKLTRVEALSSDAACQVVGQTDTQFYVAGDTKKACDYRYFAESANGKSVFSQSLSNTSNSALVRLATTETSDDAQLPPLTLAALKNTPVSVDLHAQFDAIGLDVSDWILSEAVTLPYNHDASVDVDVANQTLTYTPESDFTGIDRILFSFTDAEQNPRLGQVDIAVSVEANQGLIVEEDIIYPTSVTYDEAVDIDISPYVTSPDGDDYQLVYLQSFHADVTPSDPNDIYNKSFTFSSTTFGPNIVTFAVSDHKGSYTVGGMQIEVDGNMPWGDIIYDGMRFLAPLTTKQADAQGIVYEQGQSDSDYPSLEMAIMTPPQFEAYCASRGASVPTLEQWQALTNNVNIGDEHQWPVQYAFSVDNNGTYEQAMDNGESSPLNGAAVKPMCVQSSYLLVVPSESDLEAVANSQDQAEVAVKVTFGGELVKGENVSASLSEGSSAQLVSSDVLTDEHGVARFELTNMKVESLTLTAEYGGSQVDEQVSFIADVNTAELTLSTTVNNQPYNGTNQVTAKLEDAFDNPLVGYEVDFSADTHARSVDVRPQGRTDANGKQVAKVTWKDRPNDFNVTVRILAEFDESGVPLAARSNVTFEAPFGICGGRVNDTDRYNARGKCLKVTEANGKWFTSTPSDIVMEALGYMRQNLSSNSGRTYSSLLSDSYSNGYFAMFRQDGLGGTQHQRYCQHLADMGFAGRRNWHRPSRDELRGLHKARGNLWTNYGWPVHKQYWSETRYGAEYFIVNLGTGSYFNSPGLSEFNASCVSDY
ncbi:Ig-like domain-containing protein [Vibrio sp. Vb2110]|uniref:Ig-like domain-containing protein n=1 Tax=unclassified Vibrio TaxID=2614977 RepID=UPI0029656E1B|nr:MULTISPECIES: Ig-like domain-containing protein [unclassified Vibrio]MDG3412897.1 Ig-like domain-containing protein [Vibrio parahaemolyticus]MDW1848594.1 Ig-like domain-containing protein [Vibrio sp. Vb2130]MDW1882710.1 Ig-like domain-containing protein [Vibrio sp. Vb2110]MDW2040793.1 Ig-like domain-containing protein [Vibrio sp. 2130-1]MDW2137757.1 Ig-like domain-containing protein [Vibrio sp. 2128(2023)]